MIKMYTVFFSRFLLFSFFFFAGTGGFEKLSAQNVPELMYYKFDVAGVTAVNTASAPVGTNPSTVNGLTIGGTGQFNTALVGTGSTSTSNIVDNSWATNLVSTPWTISLWINNVPSGTTLSYLFGDAGNSMRCFVNGAPGAGNMRLVGTGLPNVDVDAVTGTPTVVHFVRETSPNQITAYRNGVLFGTFPITGTPTVGTGFKIGGYTSLGGLNGQMDEFRMYNRALDASEIAATWNHELPLNACTTPPTAGTAVASPATAICTGSTVSLNVTGSSSGSGQTYRWESSATETGTYTAFGSVSSASGTSVSPVVNTWYRVAVTCSGQTTYSTPVRVTLNTAFPAGTYTVNSALPTGGTNFASFTAAINAISCGITGAIVFNVVPNATPYNEQITIPQIGGASVSNTITINGNGAHLQFGSVNTDARAVIKMDGADYVSIKNLIINAATGTYGWGIHLTNQANNDSIVNCTVELDAVSNLSNFAGIVISGSNTTPLTAGNNANNTVIAGNTINNGYYGIVNYGTSATPFAANNRILNNTINDFYSYGIYVYGNSGATVSGNVLQRLTRTTVTTTYGLYLGTGNIGSFVEKNKIRKLFEGATASTSAVYCMYVSSDGEAGKENVIVNNVISDINHNGTIYGIYNTGGSYMQAYHNTLSLDNTAATAGITYGFYQLTSVAGIDFKNNIISITRGGSGVKYCIYKSTAATALISNYNDLYVNSAGSGAQNVGYQGGALPTLANWQATSGQDANSISVNPVFSNAATDNYTPAAVAADNKGTPVGITRDILGAARSTTTPDLGAYEFSTPVPVNLISFSAIANKNDVIASWTTATEINVKQFEIERSADGVNFVYAGVMAATGNSVRLVNYSFTDVAALMQYTPLYYRLKTIDKDGSSMHSKIILVKAGAKNNITANVYPTPVVNNAFVRISTPAPGKLSLQMMDQAGRIMSNTQMYVQAGVSIITIPGTETISAGVYLIKIIINGSETVMKLVK